MPLTRILKRRAMVEVHDLPAQVSSMPPSKRGVERKTELLDAALRVIGRDGLRGLSMQMLATEAQMPLGTIGYYFMASKN